MVERYATLRLFDFSGGLNTKSPTTSVDVNQFVDGQNLILLPRGGFEKRRGDTEFNSSAMVSGSTGVHVSYFKLKSGTEFLVAVAGTALFKSDNLDGTMDTITGSITISGGTENEWTMFAMNDTLIGVGGAPDAPWVWTGAGNATALAGSPPSGSFGFTANNRAFIGLDSTLSWSVLGNPADWTNSGSGSQNVNFNDGDKLVNGAVLNIDHALLFKENSIHDLVIRNDPFPLFPLFSEIGAISKRGIISAKGLIYFITPQARMKATDGTRIIDFPEDIDDVWDGLNTSRLDNIQGFYNKRLDQIWWLAANGSSTTHDVKIIWDLRRQKWLKDPTGFAMNSSTQTQLGDIYMGGYDGKIYQKDVANTFTDASTGSPNKINAFMRTGWFDLQKLGQLKYVPYVDLSFVAQTVGNLEFGYGYDFSEDRRVQTVSMVAPGAKWDQVKWDQFVWGGQSDLTRRVFLKGRGKVIQFLIRQDVEAQNLQFNGIEFPVDLAGSAKSA